MRGYDADLLLCSNLLEHLTDPGAFARACASLVKPGGRALVTVPYSYPYHADPIDTMFRPSPEQLVALLGDWEVDRGAIIECGRFEIGGMALVKYLARVAIPFYRPASWRGMAHRLLWMFRPYRQTMLLARKPG
jgi:SAM-dependent methyltransferase